MEQKEYWNGAADKKDFTTPFDFGLFGRFVGKNASVLDIGCGYGRILDELFRKGYTNLTGTDFSKKMIERGKRQFPHLNFMVQTGKTLDFPDESFDAVLLFAVLTCIISDKDQKFLFNEIRRVLKPAGIIYITDFMINNDERNIKRYKEFEQKYGTYGVFELPEGAVLRHHSFQYIKKALSGFNAKAFEKVIYTTMNGNKTNGFYFLGQKSA